MLLYLAESRFLRFGSFAIFYIAQGLPIGLISIAIPAWLVGQGADAADVAYFVAISGLPWGLKLFAGPFMDRFSYLSMGRRRPWVVLAQAGLLLAILFMSTVSDPVNNIVLLTWSAFAVNTFAAVQDVAVDGMAIDVLPDNERGRANAFMAFGQVGGYSASGAFSAAALVTYGITGAALVLAVGVLIIFIWAIVVRERRGEKLLPWTQGAASERSIALQATDWLSILRNLFRVMFLPASLLLILMTLAWRIQSGFWVTGTPVIVVEQLGYESTVYSYWSSTASFLAAVIGLGFGPFIDRFGTQRFILFGLIMLAATHFTAAFFTQFWSDPWFILGILFADQIFAQVVFICFIALHMNVCWERVSATQFAIYMAWANLARSIGAWLYGEMQPLENQQVFMVMGIACAIAVVLLLLVSFDAHKARLQELDTASDQGEANPNR